VAEKTKEVSDFLASFPQGMNSGIDPLLLPKGQLAYAGNGTIRSDFFNPRPAFQTIALSYADTHTAINFQTGLFQGVSYYKPDAGPESIMAAVAGRLFQITPDQSGNATVTDRTIPGDPNPAGVSQAWLFEAENYLIWNDGISAPVFFDGTNTFRSNNGLQTLLGVVALNFIVPSVGSTVAVTLASNFAGNYGQTVLIGDATYQTLAPSGFDYQANLTNYADPGTSSPWPIGTKILYNPNVVFYTGNTSGLPSNFYYNTSGHSLPAKSGQLHIPITGSYTGAYGASGAQILWNGVLFQVIGWVDSNAVVYDTSYLRIVALPYDSNPFIALTNVQTIPNNWLTPVPSQYEAFYQNGTSYPVQTVGTLSQPFTVPSTGVTATAHLTAAYTGADNLLVTVGGFLYSIIAVPPSPSGNVITVQNVNDTPLNTVTAPTDILSIPQLPTGRMGTYGMGRVWLSLPDGLSFLAGDIVGGQSGSIQNNFRDSVLYISENEYLAGGGTFRVPGSVGDIKAMQFVSLLDASLGQGPLQVFTSQNIFACQAPVDRTTWQSLTNPILVESLKGGGGTSQDAVSPANGDLLFRSSDGNLRSLLMARLDFNRWGNTPISREMQRVLDLENQSLLGFDSSTVFDNRYLLAAMPVQSPRGVCYTSILALNFDPLSSLREKQQSAWDGEWTGLNVLKLVSAPDGSACYFNGVQRCFALCLSTDLTQIELHEILPSGAASYDDGTTPITSYFESPMLDFGDRKSGQHNYKRLDYAEFYLDSIIGPVQFQAFYKPDQWPNWVPWYSWTQTYTPNTDPGFRPRVGLPSPDGNVFDTVNNRPLREGYNFQFKLVMTGPCRFLGARFIADVIPEPQRAPPVTP
jgi:hypothetical protein